MASILLFSKKLQSGSPLRSGLKCGEGDCCWKKKDFKCCLESNEKWSFYNTELWLFGSSWGRSSRTKSFLFHPIQFENSSFFAIFYELVCFPFVFASNLSFYLFILSFSAFFLLPSVQTMLSGWLFGGTQVSRWFPVVSAAHMADSRQRSLPLCFWFMGFISVSLLL